LSDVNLDELVETFLRSERLACFVSVKPRASFHMITVDEKGIVEGIEHITKSGARINGGFFVFRRDVFKYIRAGEELVEAPFRRLIAEGELLSYAHNGFWACMDTFKELQELEDLHSRGNAPWIVWNGTMRNGASRPAASRKGANSERSWPKAKSASRINGAENSSEGKLMEV
jgi:glucose-1-phosphate cytidylyltransferase